MSSCSTSHNTYTTQGSMLAMRFSFRNIQKSKLGKIVNTTSEWASIAGEAQLPSMSRFDQVTETNPYKDRGTLISYRVLKAAMQDVILLSVDPGDVPTKVSDWEDFVFGIYDQIDKAAIHESGWFVNWKRHNWAY